MALFEQYTKPGVYVRESVEDPGTTLFGDLRIPVLIGEGQEAKAHKNVEMHRGSSSVADDLVVKENLSDQVTGLTRTFHLNYFPVVKGNGQGVVTNIPTDITILVDGVPATVTSLNGTTGEFQLQSILPEGTQLEATYFFKRVDTYIENESLTEHVPAFAVWEGDVKLPLSLSIPGALGNSVKLALVSGTPTADSVAVSGIGTDTITIQLIKADTTTRTYGDIRSLIEAGIPTVAGYITLTSMTEVIAAQTPSPVIATNFVNGSGPNSNTTFKLAHTPVVDGSNGGVVTTSPSAITAKVNGAVATVRSLDGATGLFQLASPVAKGQTLEVSYYTNTYQDTYDMIPANDVASLDLVGFGPDREDFVNTVDYVLETTPSGSPRIQWGASASVAAGLVTPGYPAFDGTVITTTLVDERVFMRPVQGVVDGKNSVFTLLDVPTDGSGLSRPTNNPLLVKVYVGTDPINALNNGEVRVIQCFGESKTIKLYTPPAAGRSVFASYYRSTLNDHAYTFEVVVPGIMGQGTYTVKDELNNIVPVIKSGAHTVTEANFTTTGIVWPFSTSDLACVPGNSPNETITVTFESGDPEFTVTPAVQATAIDPENTGLTFRATNTGTAPNGVAKILFVGVTEKADAEALEVTGDVVSVYITKTGGSTRTLQEVLNLFSTNPGSVVWPATTGAVICEPSSGATLTTNAAASTTNPTGTEFSGGAAAVTTPRSLHYTVTSSRTNGDMLTDGKGRTEGTGFLNQTFESATTGVRFTILNPNDALDFGYTSLPSPSYHFRPGDVLTFVVNASEARVTSAVTSNFLAGLRTKVVSTYQMKAGDTAVVTTYNKAGNEPKVGDFYYISYTTRKSEAEFGLKLFNNPADAYALYGDPTPNNPLSLAARLFTLNGGQIFGCIQVKKESGLETASDQSYMTAISSLSAPLPGSDRKADVIVPMSTSPVVIHHLNRHLITQGSQRMSGEATGFYGYDIYATPESMRSLVRSLRAERLTAAGVPGAILEAQVQGRAVEFTVGGQFVAAALAGLALNPANDVATTLTRQAVVGFSRLIRRYDENTMDMMAADGLTCLVERDGAFQIRHWVTTDPTSPLKREPTSRLIIDYTRKIVRRNLDQFIGRKLIQSAINSVTIVATSTLKSLVDQEIIEGFKGLQVTRDESDPSVLHVSFFVKPIFSLLWVDVSLTVTTKL